jgi:hypothetical protein
VLAKEHAAELGQRVGRIVEGAEDAFPVLDAQSDHRRMQFERLLESSSYKAGTDRVFCHPDAGTLYRYEGFKAALKAAYEAAGMAYPEGMRPFHDLRVTSITNDAIAGANPIALMTKAGHASMATRRYLRLAGTVFPEEAAALEARVLGGNLLPEPSTDLSESEPTLRDLTGSDAAQLHAPA